MQAGLPPGWKDALALNRRRSPELYQHGDDPGDGAHAQEIRIMLEELALSAVFCVDRVPTIGFLVDAELSPPDLDLLHYRLWNQGLLSLLLVISREQVKVLSLARRPAARGPMSSDASRLVEVLSLVADSVRLRDLVEHVEAGRYWVDHQNHFPLDERVDAVLLANIHETIGQLFPTLGVGPAQALLMQTMFVAYLEDRRIISEAGSRGPRRDVRAPSPSCSRPMTPRPSTNCSSRSTGCLGARSSGHPASWPPTSRPHPRSARSTCRCSPGSAGDVRRWAPARAVCSDTTSASSRSG